MSKTVYPTPYVFAIAVNDAEQQYKAIDLSSVVLQHRIAVSGLTEIFNNAIVLIDLQSYLKFSAGFTNSTIAVWHDEPLIASELPKRFGNILLTDDGEAGVVRLMRKLSNKSNEYGRHTFPVLGDRAFISRIVPYICDIKLQVIADMEIAEKLEAYSVDFSLPSEIWHRNYVTNRKLVNESLYKFPVEEHYFGKRQSPTKTF